MQFPVFGVRHLSRLDHWGKSTMSVKPSILPSMNDNLSHEGNDTGYCTYVDESSLHGLGVFAGREFGVGEVIEICHVLELPHFPPQVDFPSAIRSDPLLGQLNSSSPGTSKAVETIDMLADYSFCNGTDSDSDDDECKGTTLRSKSGRTESSGRSSHRRGSLLAFGYGMLYNHSDSPNACSKLVYAYPPYASGSSNAEDFMWKGKASCGKVPRKALRIKSLTRIKKGREIFLHYGEEWWKNRRSMPLSFNFSQFRENLSDDFHPH
eukprot:GHVS01021265.1.p1 GENE.GHVS01021265.1~~GHVS01021265.1.p1  ORF type:complete len:265 (+),score=25.07 GHVS01021265.1:152-946(+)